MGFFDLFKKDKSKPETVKGPTRVLREAGIDTTGLRTRVEADGTVTVSGNVDDAATRDKIQSALEDMPHVTRVTNLVRVGAPAAETAREAPDPTQRETAAGQTAGPDRRASTAPGPAREGDRTYTVESGDTLWKISKQFYGDGSKYLRIFEANKPLLKDPDKIYPGQVLIIPDAVD